MWYCLSGNEQSGPFSIEEAAIFVRQHPDCLVWQQGMPNWLPADKVSAFSEAELPSSPKQVYSRLSYKISGDDLQYVEIELPPTGAIIAEASSMICKEDLISLESSLGGNKRQGFFGALKNAGKRVLSGENAFLSVFTNTSLQKTAKICFSAPYPGKIIPVTLDSFGGELICQRESFLCAEESVDIDIFLQKNIMTGMFGGHGFVMQKLTGNGVAFINAGGSVLEYDLKAGETVQTNIAALVAFTPSVSFNIQAAGNIKSQLFSGSGLFFGSLTGPGKVWLESMPFYRLAQKIVLQARQK